jgi:hypothetical protein
LASTADANGSISASHAARHPSGCQATLAASIPLHTDPNFMVSSLLVSAQQYYSNLSKDRALYCEIL